jgi:L-2-hydroxyglutarate oxidase
LKIGPNAIIALGRESYSRWSVGLADTVDMVFSPHFLNMVRSSEFRTVARQQIAVSFSRKRFVEDAKKLVPGVDVSDFEPWKSGIRAQLVNKKGVMVDDIVVEKKDNALHVLNAVSPGFTCSLPFADHLADQLLS